MNTSIYFGAGSQETLRILWLGFQDGIVYARRHPSVMPYVNANRVVDAAQSACERMLETVEPLDRGVFHPAYTHGWMAGYLAAHYNRDAAEDGPSLFAPAVTEQHMSQEARHDRH